MKAAQNGHESALGLLLQAKANVDLQDEVRRAPSFPSLVTLSCPQPQAAQLIRPHHTTQPTSASSAPSFSSVLLGPLSPLSPRNLLKPTQPPQLP